ncbi:TIGR03067 domain-containing protein [Paludisphaera rhizosphaerae]|uniref:TIGR03067 domain-containing protein n=1 Tax=Paludisphaera rhizosphaerae TaxID=2711216 RepID=UPI0013EA77DA|nr:TIGR03067 domain-containing protein [Paludisphaera rhizosphaerae]
MSLKLLFAFAMLLTCCAAVPGADAADVNDQMEGVWIPAKGEMAGQPLPDDFLKTFKLEVKDDKYTVTINGQVDKGDCKRDPAAKPKTLDITGTDGPNKGKTIPAIYERNGDSLKVCYDISGKERPKEFKTADGSLQFFVEYKLQKP